jgi:bacteriocin-like protein
MSNINPFSQNMSQSRQQSSSSTRGRKNLDEAQAMKSTQNFTASHGAEELSDEQLKTVSGGWYIHGRSGYQLW